MFRKIRKPAALITMVAFGAGCLMFPGSAQARWRDQSDELPGMDKGSMTPYVVGGAAAVVALTAVLIYKHHKGSASEAGEKGKDSSLNLPVPVAATASELAWSDLPGVPTVGCADASPAELAGIQLRMNEGTRCLGLSN